MSSISSTNIKLNNLKNQYIKKAYIEFRTYQVEIAKKCINHNSLVVLPTGLGKTIIAALVAAYTLELYPEKSKIIILAPTRPLINQHFESFKRLLTIQEEYFTILTGKVNPDHRTKLFHDHQIIFYTPQTLRNDLVKKKYSLESTCLIIFDEAHHASGDYPYPLIADEYMDQNPDGNILGMTASPGASKSKIKTLCQLLHIPLENIHTRTRTDQDIKTYIKPINIYKIGVDLTSLMKDAHQIIRQFLDERLQYLSHLGFLESLSYPPDKLSEKVIRKDLLKLNSELVSLVNSNGDKTGVYSALSVNAQALIIFHMLDLVEQQGLDVLLSYLLKLKEDAKKKSSSKAIKVLASDQRLHQTLLELLNHYEVSPERLLHPKYKVLEKIIFDQLKDIPDSRILVFVKLRDSVKNIMKKLNKIESIKASRFVGQSTKSKDDKGLTQKKQLEILDHFKQGKFNVLVSTNVGEEGLDIMECDLVIFYDVVVSEIRFIQRKGRTARQRKGEVIILYCKGTHDEIYLRIVMNRLKRMDINLKTQERTQKDVKILQTKPNMGSRKGLFKFIDTKGSLEKVSQSKTVKLSLNIPMKFGFRKKLQNEGIIYTLNNQLEHIVIFDKILIQIYAGDSFSESLQNEITQFIMKWQPKYQLILIIIDYIDFKERINGELRVIKKKIRKFAEEFHFKIIPIEDEEEVWFILRSLLENRPREG